MGPTERNQEGLSWNDLMGKLAGRSTETWRACNSLHRVYEAALQRELDAITQEVKQMADRIKTPSDLWALEDYLTQSRKEINRKFDYRYSVLPIVFAQLVTDGRITPEELHGLAEDKLRYVRFASESKARKPL